MDSSAAPNEGPEGLNHWQYEDNVFPLTAHPRLLSTWKLIEAWLRILQLLALLGVLTWSMFFLPELLRVSFTSNLDQHAPALKHLQSTTTQSTPSAPESQSGPLQQLKPEDSAEAYQSSVSEYLAQSRATSDWLVLVCLPGMALGSAVGVLISWICLPASRWRTLGFGLLLGAAATGWSWLSSSGWLRLSTALPDRSGGQFMVGPQNELGVFIDGSVYDKLMLAWSVNDLPAATLSMTLGGLIAIWIARPITRFVMRLLLPPASRWHIAWLWTADGLRVPGAQRSSS